MSRSRRRPRVDDARFAVLVDEAEAAIPAELRRHLENVAGTWRFMAPLKRWMG